MDGIRFRRVCRRAESVEHYHRLYAVLKGVLPEYVGGISLLETSPVQKDYYSCAAFLEEVVVGGYVIEDEGETAHLRFIGLTEGLRGKGLGKRMIEDMSSVSKIMGKKRIIAQTSQANLEKFRKMGFCGGTPSHNDKTLLWLYRSLP